MQIHPKSLNLILQVFDCEKNQGTWNNMQTPHRKNISYHGLLNQGSSFCKAAAQITQPQCGPFCNWRWFYYQARSRCRKTLVPHSTVKEDRHRPLHQKHWLSLASPAHSPSPAPSQSTSGVWFSLEQDAHLPALPLPAPPAVLHLSLNTAGSSQEGRSPEPRKQEDSIICGPEYLVLSSSLTQSQLILDEP